MDWTQFLSMLGSAVLGGGGISGIVIYLWQKKIDQRYAKELEGYKAGYQKFLDENRVRFNWWHEEQAKAIKEFYSKVAELHYHIDEMILLVKSLPRDDDKKKDFNLKHYNCVSESLNVCQLFWQKNKIFFPGLDNDIEELFRSSVISSISYCELTLADKSASEKDMRKMFEESTKLLEKLRKSFQQIVQGEKESVS